MCFAVPSFSLQCHPTEWGYREGRELLVANILIANIGNKATYIFNKYELLEAYPPEGLKWNWVPCVGMKPSVVWLVESIMQCVQGLIIHGEVWKGIKWEKEKVRENTVTPAFLKLSSLIDKNYIIVRYWIAVLLIVVYFTVGYLVLFLTKGYLTLRLYCT